MFSASQPWDNVEQHVLAMARETNPPLNIEAINNNQPERHRQITFSIKDDKRDGKHFVAVLSPFPYSELIKFEVCFIFLDAKERPEVAAVPNSKWQHYKANEVEHAALAIIRHLQGLPFGEG